MLDWPTLVRLPDAALARLDVVEMDAACSAGLPGIRDRDVGADKRKVDEMARSCRAFTDHRCRYFTVAGAITPRASRCSASRQ